MNRLLALEIETSYKVLAPGKPLFDSKQIRIYLAGLGVVYEEAFIVSTHQHVAAWVVGEHQGLLINSFKKYDDGLCRVNLFLKNNAARFLFQQVTIGKRWQEVSSAQTLSLLAAARDMAFACDCLGPVLLDLIAENLKILSSQNSDYSQSRSHVFN